MNSPIGIWKRRTHAENDSMKFGKEAVVGVLVIVSTLVIFNLILYGVLPPAQPKPAVTHAQQARQAAESAGTLAGFYDFDGDLGEAAWYPTEKTDLLDGSTYQYMAQTDSPLTLTVACAAPWTLEVVVMDRLTHLARPEVSLAVNGTPVAATKTRMFRRWVYQATIPDGKPGDWMVDVSVPELIRPSDLFATEDDRPLGVAADWILVTGADCG